VPLIQIAPRKGLAGVSLRELWAARELIYFLGWRDVKVRYKQTAFGAAWAVIQPLALMGVFALVMSHFLKVSSQGFPYPIFAYTALLPWTLFSQSLAQSSQSLTSNAQLISKVYFPRIALPIAATAPFILDFLVGSVLLIAMMAAYGVSPSIGLALVPLFALLAVVTALGTGFLLSALNARYRDVQAAIPLLVQLWLFASPIAYPSTLVPAGWRTVYALNPMVTVVDGFRWALLSAPAPTPGMVVASVAVACVLAVVGLIYFQSTEREFADVI
jgi:lipopolysaccharide transport system permease protein